MSEFKTYLIMVMCGPLWILSLAFMVWGCDMIDANSTGPAYMGGLILAFIGFVGVFLLLIPAFVSVLLLWGWIGLILIFIGVLDVSKGFVF